MPSHWQRTCGRPGVWLLIVVAASIAIWLVPASGVATAQEAAGTPAAAQPEDSLFMHIVKSAGPIFGGLLLLLSFCLVALIALLIFDLRLGVAIPPAFVEQFTDTVNKRKFPEAFDLAKGNSSAIATVMTDGMARLKYGLDDAREAALNKVDSLRSSKEQLNNYVAVISSLGPLIGLVGTVYGMILSFRALSHGGPVDASRLAGGISHALVITMLGIGLAVPGVFFNAFFRNRITRIAMDTANLSDDLLTQMYHHIKKAEKAERTSAAEP